MKLKKVLTVFACLCSPAAFAAADGSLGATSQGSTDVSITIDDLVQVSGLTDIALGTATVGTDSTGNTGLCIYRNSDADVNVTLSSANASGTAFRLVNSSDATAFLGYSVDLSGSTTAVTGASSGVATTISDENNSSSTCGGTDSHTIAVKVLGTDIDAAVAGSYTDTLTILVAPN